MGVGSNRLEIVFVGQKGVRSSDEAAAKIGRHGFDNIFLPQKAVPPTGSEIRNAEARYAAQPFDLAP